MALNLEVKTNNAAAQIKLISDNLEILKKAVSTFPASTKLTNSLGALNNFKGVDVSAANSIEKLAVSIDKLGNAKDVGRVASGLKSLGKVDVAAVTVNIEKLVASISRLNSAPGFQNIISSLGRFAASAQIAARSTQQLQTAINGIRTPAALNTATGHLGSFAQATNAASNAQRGFSSSLGSVNGLLAAFGISLGAVGIARFTSELSQTQQTMDTFRATTDTMLGAVGGSARALEFLTKTAHELHLPLETLVDSYSQFSTAATLSGRSIDDTERIYKNFSTVLRGIGANATDTARTFKAVEQMFNKGAIKAEELTNQLGDVLPGALQVLANSMGVTTAELTKMMEAGAVGSENILKFSEEFATRFSGVAQALGSSWGAALADLSTAWTQFKMAFGGAFFAEVTPAVQGLAAALAEFATSDGLKAAGATIGLIASAVVNLATAIVQFASTDIGGVALALGGIAMAGGLAYKALAMLLGMFAPVGAAATVMGSAMTALGALLGSISFSGILTGLTSFAAALAAGWAAINPLVGGAALLVGGLVALDAALGGPISQLLGFSSAADEANSSATSLATSFNAVTDPVLSFADALKVSEAASKGQAVSYQNLDKAGQELAGRIVELEGQQDSLAKSANAGEISYEQFKEAMDALDGEISNLKTQLSGVAQAQKNAQSAAQGLNSQLFAAQGAGDAAAAGYDSAADAARRYVDAARAAQAAQSSSSASVDTFAGGGTSSGGSNRTKRISAAAFVDAPMLATGTANTSTLGAPVSGMPAILHPNEAVVPLAGGGQIPVQMSGGGSDAPYLLKMIEIQTQTKSEMGRIWTAINAHTTIVKRLLETNNEYVLSLVNTNTALASAIAEVLREVRAAARAPSSGGGGGGGGYSGGGSSGGGSSGGGGSNNEVANYSEFARQARELSNALSEANDAASSFYNSQPYIQMGTGNASAPRAFLDQGAQTQYNSLRSAAAGRSSAFLDFLATNPDFAERYYRNLAAQALPGQYRNQLTQTANSYEDGTFRRGNGSGGDGRGVASYGFATGSPNAYRDMMGGFQATLHPDEAVIPLPDGRSVPVSLPDSVLSQLSAMQRQANQDVTYGARGSSRGSGSQPTAAGGTTVIMNIQTQDAASFQRSQPQIMQDLSMKLERVSDRLGTNRSRVIPARRS